MPLFGLLQHGVMPKADCPILQIGVTRRHLGGNDFIGADIQKVAVDIGQLLPAFVDAVEVGVSLEHILLRGRCGARPPGLKRRQIGVFRPVLPRHLCMQRPPVVHALFRDEGIELRLVLIILVELLHVGRRHHDPRRHGGRKARQELRVRDRPAIPDRHFVDHLDGRDLVIRLHLQRHARKLVVHHHVFERIAQVFGRKGGAVGPAVPFAQHEGKDPPVLNIVFLKDVGHEAKVPVISHQPRIAQDRHHAHILLAAHQHAHLAAVAPRRTAKLGGVDDPRHLRKPGAHLRHVARHYRFCQKWRTAQPKRRRCAERRPRRKKSQGFTSRQSFHPAFAST